jgi:hypothetical protein
LLGVLFVIGGLVLASFGYINPIVAAMMHVAGSLIVVFNSFRLVRQGEELEPYHPTPTSTRQDAETHIHDHKHEPVVKPSLA